MGGAASRRAKTPPPAVESERRLYEDLFELAPSPYLVTDRDGVILRANRAAGRVFGRDADSLAQTSLAELVGADGRPALRAALGRSSGDQAATVELDLVGAAPPVSVSAAVAADERGGSLRWILHDVTRVRKRERELEARVAERTDILSAVLNHIPLGIALVDAESQNVVAYNPRAEQLLGDAWDRVSPPRTFAAEARRPDGHEVGGDDWPSVRALRGEVVLGELLRIRTADGDEHLFEISAAPVEAPDGRVTFAVLAFQDVAERERRDHAVRMFVTNAAHELGTPLAGIIAAVEALQAGAKEEPAHRDRFLEHVGREAARLERLTRALLVLARVQARAEPADLAVVPLAPLIAEVAATVSPADGVVVDVACAPDAAAVSNRPLLEQALSNLAGNAARYTKRGTISLSAERRGRRVEIVVADSGPGIPDEVRSRLFERFVRGPGETGGFGLGLAIARDSVEAIGGSLELETPPQGGTRAVIRLPAARLVGGT